MYVRRLLYEEDSATDTARQIRPFRRAQPCPTGSSRPCSRHRSGQNTREHESRVVSFQEAVTRVTPLEQTRMSGIRSQAPASPAAARRNVRCRPGSECVRKADASPASMARTETTRMYARMRQAIRP
jgi:hypothetical protein